MQSQLLLSGPIDELAPMVSTDSEMVTLTINNQEVSVPASFSILDACRKFGFFVPTVCHHPRMKPLGRCKVCVVEMEDTGNLAMSCSTRVENGMKVRTDTPRVRTKAAECLRDLKERQKSRAMPKLNVDKSEFDNVMEWADSAEMENNGSIFIDPTQCVECGRCATACTSLQDMNILELPPKSAVKPIGGIHLRDTPCIACGQCASFCPTNAISEEKLSQYLSSGSGLLYRAPHRMTLLMAAAQHDRRRVVEMLLKREGGSQDDFGATALVYAARAGHVRCVELLLQERGTRDRTGRTALMHAAEMGHADVVRALREGEAGRADDMKETALMKAAARGYLDCVNLLAETEAGVKDGAGRTALHHAAAAGHLSCVDVLAKLEAGSVDSAGNTALMACAGGPGHIDCVRRLAPLEMQQTNQLGYTALMLAAREGHGECVALLLDEQEKVSALGRSALMLAAWHGHFRVCSQLVQREQRMQDSKGNTALALAAHQ
ncbi:hypothetical protein KIPB_007190, partial [Kipferlia bialata]|eukprot:g7190.t1